MNTPFVAAVLLVALGFEPSAILAGITPSKCDAVSENLVGNCGFKTGTFEGWLQRSGPCFCAISEEARATGNFGLEHAGLSGLEYIAQNLPTAVGREYSLSFWLRNRGQPNAFQVWWDGVFVYDWVDAPNLDWTLVELNGLVASRDISELRFGFYNEPDW